MIIFVVFLQHDGTYKYNIFFFIQVIIFGMLFITLKRIFNFFKIFFRKDIRWLEVESDIYTNKLYIYIYIWILFLSIYFLINSQTH